MVQAFRTKTILLLACLFASNLSVVATNLLPNGDFENGATGWRSTNLAQGGSWEVVGQNGAPSGSKVLKIVNTSNTPNDQWKTQIQGAFGTNMTAGTTYNISLYVKSESAGRFRISLTNTGHEEYDGKYCHYQNDETTSAAWQQYRYTIVSNTSGSIFENGISLDFGAVAGTYYVDKIEVSTPNTGGNNNGNAPILPSKGAYYSNVYRNMLAEAGYSQTDINNKLNALWNKLFCGNANTESVYYPVGTDEAYILDVNNNDVRSEGMSYGMMICVQMNKQAEFNRLWKWAKNHMQFSSGARAGYFSWQNNTNGSRKDENTASDGEEYFVMALMFAANRWGNGEGIYNYWKEANYILDCSMAKPQLATADHENQSITNLFNTSEKQVVFTPFAQAASYTDPSYHLPAFYQLWSFWADNNRAFFGEMANKSREMWPRFAHPVTGLMPDYAYFNGTPNGSGGHNNFRYDAWRCIMNMAVDYAWFKASENEVAQVNKMHNFFASKGVTKYYSNYTLDGNQDSGNSDHSPGLVACNAAGALASNQAIAWNFIDDFFHTEIPSGQMRYYDGLLYFLNYLHLSGNFKIYKPNNAANKEIKHGNTPKIFPNPTTDFVCISNSTCTQYKIVAVSTGKTLLQGKITAEKIDCSTLPKGMYLLYLQNTQTAEKQVYKFIKTSKN